MPPWLRGDKGAASPVLQTSAPPRAHAASAWRTATARGGRAPKRPRRSVWLSGPCGKTSQRRRHRSKATLCRRKKALKLPHRASAAQKTPSPRGAAAGARSRTGPARTRAEACLQRSLNVSKTSTLSRPSGTPLSKNFGSSKGRKRASNQCETNVKTPTKPLRKHRNHSPGASSCQLPRPEAKHFPALAASSRKREAPFRHAFCFVFR